MTLGWTRTRPGLRRDSVTSGTGAGPKLAGLFVIALAGALLAPACGESGSPPARLTFTFDRSGNRDITLPTVGSSGSMSLTSVLPWDGFPAWSPDGSRVAYYAPSPGERLNRDIYVAAADGSEVEDLTDNPDNPAEDSLPSWSPDGSLIAFYSDRDGNGEVYTMPADGSDATRLTRNPAVDFPYGWSPDGTRILFGSFRDGNLEIYSMNRDGTDTTRLTDDPAQDIAAAYSADGSRIAFESQRGGESDVHVMDPDGSRRAN